MFEVYAKAVELPQLWDDLVRDNIFLKRDYLMGLEILNSCGQTYHLDTENRIAFVCYKLMLDLFTYSDNLSLKFPVNIIGIPMSVSRCGYYAEGSKALLKLEEYIKELKGLHLILNSEDNIGLGRGKTLPECVLYIKWGSLEEYFCDLRSSYRYRLKKAVNRFSEVKVEELKYNCTFDKEMYGLYEEVYKNSDAKLEKLDIKFFKNFPSKILKFTLNGKAVAFIQLVEDGDELIFLFGGFRHDLNKQYDLYINMLLKIIQYGTEKGFKKINLGQTSEETKLKLGAVQHPKHMYAYHSNFLFNFILNSFIGKFSYQEYNTVHRVFKEQEEERHDFQESIAG